MATSPVEPIAHLPDTPPPAGPTRMHHSVRAALRTAENLNVGTAEVLRYANEGPRTDHAAFSDEAISSVAQGLHDLMRLERPHLLADGDTAGVDLLDYLSGEVSRFLVDWVGERQ